MSQTEMCQAFVLGTIDYGEADRIVTLFTLEHGRIKAFARGARKSRKRFGAALEPCSRIEAEVRLAPGLASLRRAEMTRLLLDPAQRMAPLFHALYGCELVELLTPEGHPLPRLFRLLTAYLEHLPAASSLQGARRFFEINLLNILGYRPPLNGCASCAAPFTREDVTDITSTGELLCAACRHPGRGFSMSAPARQKLARCLETGSFGRITLSGTELREAGTLLDRAIAQHCQRALRSAEFLDYNDET